MPFKSRDEWSVSPSLPALCAPWPRFRSHGSLSKVYCLNSRSEVSCLTRLTFPQPGHVSSSPEGLRTLTTRSQHG
jgi:hypothetical protein